MSVVTMKQLLESGCHFGHQTNRWNPKMRRYIYGARNGIYIIDLQKTLTLFQEAYDFVRDVAAEGGRVLFVGTKRQSQDAIREEAIRCGQFWVTTRWLGGTLTNFKTMKGRIQRLRELEEMKADGYFELLTKKRAATLERERQRLDKFLGGIKEMEELPGAVFIIDPRREKIVVNETRRLEIPTTGMVDTNCDPDDITYTIPCNDDAIRAIRLVTSKMADAVLEGLDQRAAVAADEGEEAEEVVKPEAELVAGETQAEEAAADKPAESKDEPSGPADEVAAPEADPPEAEPVAEPDPKQPEPVE
ncbi:MAG: 30S ribosomal protein S2 [bacterium]|nr:30S ribosomal protein S2 [bacterium]